MGLAMTEMACDEPLMQQDTWFADILTSEPTLLQDDTTLTLTSDDTVIVFTDEEVVVPDASLTGTTVAARLDHCRRCGQQRPGGREVDSVLWQRR